MKLKQFGWLVLLAANAVLSSGCATSAVWRTGAFSRYCEPANPPDLRLFHSPQKQDVLVEYTESRENEDLIRRRVYWLHENAKRLQHRRKPQFVGSEDKQGLVPLAVLQPGAAPEPSLAGGLYAVASTNGYGFTLYSAGKEEGSYELPVYGDDSGRVTQVLLTPPAVVADVAIVGGIIALATLPWWWTGLNQLVH